MSRVLVLAIGSIFIGILVLLLKGLAYRLTGSVALYSDALESIINIITAVAALIAIRLSAIPPDHNHPYGHQKAEYLSVILEGVCISLAAVSILREAAVSLQNPRPLDAPILGLAVSAVGTGINAVWGMALIRAGRAGGSPALVADGKHLFVDVFTSLGVVAGVGLVVVTGILQLDAIVAGLVAVNILWSGWGLVKESVGALMDEAVSPERLDTIQSVLAIHSGDTIEIHDLRTRAAGRVTFIEFHLVVASEMTVAESHGICDRLEKALRAAVSDAAITIHVEPADKAKQTGVMVLS